MTCSFLLHNMSCASNDMGGGVAKDRVPVSTTQMRKLQLHAAGACPSPGTSQKQRQRRS